MIREFAALPVHNMLRDNTSPRFCRFTESVENGPAPKRRAHTVNAAMVACKLLFADFSMPSTYACGRAPSDDDGKHMFQEARWKVAQIHVMPLLAGILIFLPVLSASAQNPSAGLKAGAPAIVDQMSAAFSGRQTIHRIQLSGAATLQAGSLQDSGTATLTAAADGSAQIQLALSSTGTRTETQTAANANRICQWSGSDGEVHDTSGANCLTAIDWFLPQIILQPTTPLSILSANYAGVQSTEWGDCHVFTNQVNLGSKLANAAAVARIQRQSSTTLYLDSSTALPKVMRYQLVSDAGNRQIAVEVRYSAYRTLSGVSIPSHIERYLNGSLELTFDITQATIMN
jgi:hypothetical protein